MIGVSGPMDRDTSGAPLKVDMTYEWEARNCQIRVADGAPSARAWRADDDLAGSRAGSPGACQGMLRGVAAVERSDHQFVLAWMSWRAAGDR